MKLRFKNLILLFLSMPIIAQQETRFVITADDLTLVNPDTRQASLLPVAKIIVTAHEGALYLNKKRLCLPVIIIKSSTNTLRCNGKKYSDALIISYMRDGSCSCVSYAPYLAERKASTCLVKVLLEEKEEQKSACWTVKSKEKLLIVNPGNKKKKRLIKNIDLTLELKKGVLYINNRRYTEGACIIMSSDNNFLLNDTLYHGSLFITTYKNKYLIINYVPIEEYLSSVLHSESWPGWPLEVNKVFAITSRSYVIAMIMEAKKSDKPYHVKNTNIHQTYRGAHTKKILKDAVEQTKGVFLAHNEMPITAMFDSCCGGIIPAHIHGPNFEKAPYLARTYPCTYCKKCKLFSWQVEYDAHSLRRLLLSVYDSFGHIKGFKVSKKDKAGLVKEIQVKGPKSTENIPVKQLYSCLKEVKSFCFSAQHKSNKVILKGKGYGHHIGLCQWGAREMVRQGWDYKSILQFYYPGTMFMKLS